MHAHKEPCLSGGCCKHLSRENRLGPQLALQTPRVTEHEMQHSDPRGGRETSAATLDPPQDRMASPGWREIVWQPGTSGQQSRPGWDFPATGSLTWGILFSLHSSERTAVSQAQRMLAAGLFKTSCSCKGEDFAGIRRHFGLTLSAASVLTLHLQD